MKLEPTEEQLELMHAAAKDGAGECYLGAEAAERVFAAIAPLVLEAAARQCSLVAAHYAEKYGDGMAARDAEMRIRAMKGEP